MVKHQWNIGLKLNIVWYWFGFMQGISLNPVYLGSFFGSEFLILVCFYVRDIFEPDLSWVFLWLRVSALLNQLRTYIPVPIQSMICLRTIYIKYWSGLVKYWFDYVSIKFFGRWWNWICQYHQFSIGKSIS